MQPASDVVIPINDWPVTHRVVAFLKLNQCFRQPAILFAHYVTGNANLSGSLSLHPIRDPILFKLFLCDVGCLLYPIDVGAVELVLSLSLFLILLSSPFFAKLLLNRR